MKVEGENRMLIESVVDEIARRYKVQKRTALKYLCKSIVYNRVYEVIEEEISFLIMVGKLEKEKHKKKNV